MDDLEARVAVLEAELAQFKAFFRFGVNPFDQSAYVMTAGRFGVMTDFWSQKPFGQGAAFSVGTVSDRFAIYAENEAAVCPDHPTTAIYAAAVAPNATQYNIAIEAHAANADHGSGGLLADAPYPVVNGRLRSAVFK